MRSDVTRPPTPSPLAGEGGTFTEGVGAEGLTLSGKIPLIRRQFFAIFASSLITSISTLGLVMIWGVVTNGPPDWPIVLRDFVFLLAFIIPIAAFGITFFGLPVLFVVRRLGWISTIARFKLFGAATGTAWAVIAGLLLSFRAEVLPFTALIGSMNGLLVAWLWLNIVDKFRASQRHKIPNGEVS